MQNTRAYLVVILYRQDELIHDLCEVDPSTIMNLVDSLADIDEEIDAIIDELEALGYDVNLPEPDLHESVRVALRYN